MTGAYHECERLRAAVVDGRFLEDPAFWQIHLNACKECQKIAASLVALRDQIDRGALERPVATPLGGDVIATAIERYRAYRLIRGMAFAVCLVLIVGVAGSFLIRSGPAERPDPVTYARGLYERVAPRHGPPRTDLLRQDEGLRKEYLAALDDPSGLVRRAALTSLMLSGVGVERSRLESILERSREDLETPIEVASAGEAGLYLTEALEVRRVATLQSVLGLAGTQASRSGGAVRVSLLTPYLSHQDAEVRKRALFALTFDTTYRPGDEVTSLMARDSDAGVRLATASCLLLRLGEDGAKLVAKHLRSHADPEVEGHVVPSLGTSSELVSLAHERIADANTPLLLALLYTDALVRAGHREPPPALIGRSLDSADGAVHARLALVAARADWTACREPLQERWQRATSPHRQNLATILIAWDERTGTEERLTLAIAICEADRGEPALRTAVERLTRVSAPRIAARARELLANWNKAN